MRVVLFISVGVFLVACTEDPACEGETCEGSDNVEARESFCDVLAEEFRRCEPNGPTDEDVAACEVELQDCTDAEQQMVADYYTCLIDGGASLCGTRPDDFDVAEACGVYSVEVSGECFDAVLELRDP